MKIPKYIDKKIKKRTKLAEELKQTSYELDFWLEKNGFKLDEFPLCQAVGDSVMVICEPDEAEEILREYIKKTERHGEFVALPKCEK